MNKVAQILMDKAASLKESTPELVAVGLLKQAGLSEEDARVAVAQDAFEKQACFEMTHKGIDAEEASKLVKAAKVDIRGLPGITQETEEEMLASILEKAASYIEKQAAYIDMLEQAASEVHTEVVERIVEVEKPAMSESMTKLASIGAFTFEDLEALQSMSENVLTKVASAIEEPWELGKAAGVSRPKTDPLLEFILG